MNELEWISEREADYEVRGIEEALLRQSQLLALENPSSRVRKAVVRWFAHTDPLVGVGRDIFADTRDLVALRTAPDQDRLSLFLQDHLGYLFRVSCLEYPSPPPNVRNFPLLHESYACVVDRRLAAPKHPVGALCTTFPKCSSPASFRS